VTLEILTIDPNDDAEEDEEDADEAEEAEENHGPPWDIYLVNPTSGELLEVEVDAADGTVLDVETAEDFAQEFEDDGTEEGATRPDRTPAHA
jgi:hypothetical protein